MTTQTKTLGYTSLGRNIYQVTTGSGNRYRVRATVNGTRYDEYFTNKTKALKFRNELFKSRVS